jgi:phenylacetate-CoA ligase
MTPDNLDHYVKEYNAFKPKFIRGYPSSIYIVANHILQNNISVHKPLGVFCSSEVLTPQFKSVIEKAFGAPAINWYGSNERAITASQCEYRNGLHVHEEAGILEVVNEKGESSITNRAVTEGEIVVTGVVNAAMPLIRYRLGDYGILETEPCSCGFQGTTLKEIVGRTDDIIVTPAGKSVPPVRFYTLFEKFPSVNGFQIVQQKDVQHIAVNIISKTKVDEAKLLEALSYFVGNDVNFTINYVEEIKAEASGKRKLIKVLK